MKRKKAVLFSCVISICLIAAVIIMLFPFLERDKPRYNLSPDVSKKTVGSRDSPITRMMPRTFDDVFAEATCVIIGKVIEDGVRKEGDRSWSVKRTDLTLMAYTTAIVEVIEVIAGEPPSAGIILYRQFGFAGNDWMQTKVKKGETYAFILMCLRNANQYMATAFEESVFHIDEKNRLTSLSDQLFCARYDGIDLGVFIEDVKEMQERIFIDKQQY